MLHVSRRLMVNSPEYESLVSSYGGVAFWPLNDTSFSTTAGTLDELLGGSDDTWDKWNAGPGGDFGYRSDALMSSTNSDASLRLGVTSSASAACGNIVAPNLVNECSLVVWFKWSQYYLSTSASGTFYSKTVTSGPARWAWMIKNNTNTENDQFFYALDGVQTLDFGTLGVSGLSPVMWTVVQDYNGSQYRARIYANTTLVRTSSYGADPIIANASSTAMTVSLGHFDNFPNGHGTSIYWQSLSYHTQALSAAQVSALYSAGKL